MTKIQKYIYFFALFLNITIIGLEMGESIVGKFFKSTDISKDNTPEEFKGEFPDDLKTDINSLLPNIKIPGASIKAIAVIDIYLLLTMICFGLNYFIDPSLITKGQGIVTIIISFSIIGFILYNITILIAKVMLMLGLLLAPIFGTIAYFALYASYDKKATIKLIGLLMSLKISLIISFLVTNIKYISNIGLIALIATPMGILWLLNIGFSLVPGFLLRIADGIFAIIILIVALIWSVKFLISSILSLKALVAIG